MIYRFIDFVIQDMMRHVVSTQIGERNTRTFYLIVSQYMLNVIVLIAETSLHLDLMHIRYYRQFSRLK